MISSLPAEAQQFIASAIAIVPPPAASWLFGSRANDKANEASDTDMMIIGSPAFLAALRATVKPPPGVDCHVVTDGDAWTGAFREKYGSLTGWGWNAGAEGRADYRGSKWIPSEEHDDSDDGDGLNGGWIHEPDEIAIRIWPA